MLCWWSSMFWSKSSFLSTGSQNFRVCFGAAELFFIVCSRGWWSWESFPEVGFHGWELKLPLKIGSISWSFVALSCLLFYALYISFLSCCSCSSRLEWEWIWLLPKLSYSRDSWEMLLWLEPENIEKTSFVMLGFFLINESNWSFKMLPLGSFFEMRVFLSERSEQMVPRLYIVTFTWTPFVVGMT